MKKIFALAVFFLAYQSCFGETTSPVTCATYELGSYPINYGIRFDASRSYDTDGINGGRTKHWYWDFDYDGTNFTIDADAQYLYRAFSHVGMYKVAARFYDDDGQAGNIVTMTITIGPLKAYYYLKDHLGSVRMTVDAGGNVAGYDDYDAYGQILPGRSSNNGLADSKYKFTGKERDAETGLDYFGARYYDSWRGQWLSVDPMAELHPDYSPYAYVFNNPLLLVDPDGQDSTQRAAAVADAKDYVSKNPDRDPNLYGPLVEGKDGKKHRAPGQKGGPGHPCDCSGVVSHNVKAAGLPDPNHGPGPRGVQNLVANMRPVLTLFAQPGNTVFFTNSKGDLSHHTGTLIAIEVGATVTLTVIQSGVSTGPSEVTFTPGVGKPGSLGATFQGLGTWDTPDLLIHPQTVTSDALRIP